MPIVRIDNLTNIDSNNNMNNGTTYECSICLYVTNKIYSWKKHLATNKHISNINNMNNGTTYECSICSYVTTKTYRWKKHLCTNKHIDNINTVEHQRTARNIDLNEGGETPEKKKFKIGLKKNELKCGETTQILELNLQIKKLEERNQQMQDVFMNYLKQRDEQETKRQEQETRRQEQEAKRYEQETKRHEQETKRHEQETKRYEQEAIKHEQRISEMQKILEEIKEKSGNINQTTNITNN